MSDAKTKCYLCDAVPALELADPSAGQVPVCRRCWQELNGPAASPPGPRTFTASNWPPARGR